MRLSTADHRPEAGRPWSHEAVLTVLHHLIGVGKVAFQELLADGPHPNLVDEQLVDDAGTATAESAIERCLSAVTALTSSEAQCGARLGGLATTARDEQARRGELNCRRLCAHVGEGARRRGDRHPVAHQRTGVHRRRHAGSRGAPLRARPRDPRRKSHRRRTAVPRARRRDYKVRAPERSVPPAGLEPATWWVEATRSVQLSYRGAVRGISDRDTVGTTDVRGRIGYPPALEVASRVPSPLSGPCCRQLRPRQRRSARGSCARLRALGGRSSVG
jgi:hypothetical protein